VSYSVTRQVHEFGIRAALGATGADIMRLVTREALTVSMLGAAVGIGLAYGVAAKSASLFVGMPRLDLLSLATAPVCLVAIVVIAGYLPARRAARANPLDALRAL
jgi:ABC-type antimicrobial peptide transport system permease subunit